jgi:hypothetical protein
VVTGLVTYMVHGVMNSFLDSDKIAALWWGFIALIVAMDLDEQRIAGATVNDSNPA